MNNAVVIRGVTYPSGAAAARANGVTPEAVYAARRAGTLHRVGCGRPGAEAMPVALAGKVYASAEAASKALNIKLTTIYAAIADGDPDRVLRANRYNSWRSRPFSIGGLTYPSMRQASRALGFANDEFISRAIKRGSKRGWQRILAAAMREEARRAASARLATQRRIDAYRPDGQQVAS